MKLSTNDLFYHSPNAWFGIYMKPTTDKIRTSSNGDSVITTATCSFNVLINHCEFTDPGLYVFKFEKKDEIKT